MPQNITDSSVFTDPIVVPADADPADLTYILTLAQGLANRTRRLFAQVASPIARERGIPLVGNVTNNPTATPVAHEWDPNHASSQPSLTTTVDGARIFLPVPIEVGETVLGFDVSCDPGAARATGHRLFATLYAAQTDWAGTGTTVLTSLGTHEDNGSSVQQKFGVTLGSPYTLVAGDVVYLFVQSGDTSASFADTLYAARLRYQSRDSR